MEVDFAIRAQRLMPSLTLTRACALTLGRSGILEIDCGDAEVYEWYELRSLKDIII